LQRFLILSGTVLLGLAGMMHLYGGRMRIRLQLLRKTQRVLRRAVRAAADTPNASAFDVYAMELQQALHLLRRQWQAAPRLPFGRSMPDWLMHLARTAAENEQFAPDALVHALSANAEASSSSVGAALFPLFVAFAGAERLCSALERFVKEQGASTRNAAQTKTIPVCEALRQAAECFRAMLRLNWLPRGEEADEIHQSLLADPAGVYPRMTAQSRLALRMDAEAFSAHTGVSRTEAVQAAISLSRQAENQTLEAYAGYWFQEPEGMRQLHRVLKARRGWFYVRFTKQQEALRYVLLWIFGAAAGFAFLQAGNPVFMLPVFSVCAGCMLRWIVKPDAARIRPAMEINELSEHVHTLVVLPVLLREPKEAIAAVRQLKTARQAFPQQGVDFLLLGDFGDSMTPVSSLDAPIIKTAWDAVNALNSSGIMYLQRGRAWDAARHTYGPRGGTRGAVREICRLIVQGECGDVIAFSSVQAADFERRYAYVMVLKEKALPHPGMFERLLSIMTHPMNTRYPAVNGWRGYAALSPEGCRVYQGFGLLRPDAFLEATDGYADPMNESDMLCGELAGHAAVPGARMTPPPPEGQWDTVFHKAFRTWQVLAWQLPWVHAAMGVVRNPLGFFARFHLREQLRRTLLPAARCLLMLWAILTQRWPLLILGAAASQHAAFPRTAEECRQAVFRFALLPSEAAVSISGAIWALLRKRRAFPAWANLEVWAQGIAAAILTALGLSIPGMALPALMLAALFASFPLVHRWQDLPLHSSAGLTDRQFALLEHAASATWRYFEHILRDKAWPLPPCAVQYEPPLGTEQAASPTSIGAALLACICARDLGMISADQAASAMERFITPLNALSMPFGLPCRRYSLPELSVLDPCVDAAETGFLAAALLTAAQALRTWLPELDASRIGLSRQLQALADSFDLSQLYDPEAQLFHAGLDMHGQGVGHIQSLTDAALLLSIAAHVRRDIPPEHFSRLDYTWVRLKGGKLPRSLTGSAITLLPGLFIPADVNVHSAFVRAMMRRGSNGLWGVGPCAYDDFDADLKYRQGKFGIPGAALTRQDNKPVFTPYAAALCLPAAPHDAADSLMCFQSLGALGPQGFCDAIDCTRGAALVGLHDTFHQGVILMALAHLLADAPVQRYFCALPEIEACLPLLRRNQPDSLLSALPVRTRLCPAPEAAGYAVPPLSDPTAEHQLGTEAFRMLADNRGCSCIYDGDRPLTRHHADGIYGIQFYVADEERVYRIGSPLLPGQTIFAPGEVRQERICGSLKAELVCTVDTIRRRAVHLLQLTNLSTLDRIIETADLLLPDLGVPSDTLQPEHPETGRLILRARCTDDLALHHTMDCASQPLSACVCTDAACFLGPGGSLHQPDAMTADIEDQVIPSAVPCMSFRARLTVGGRGQILVWFTTSLEEHEPPRLTELDGFRRLASLQHQALQAERITQPVPPVRLLTLPIHAWKLPKPALTPDLTLLYPGLYGGFDPQTDDYVVLLAPGVHTPVPWENHHVTRHHRETVNKNAFGSMLPEQVWITTADDELLSPWSAALPRSIRLEAGMTVWDAWSDKLDIRLCACCLPGHRFGMRVLRIRNASDMPLHLSIFVQKRAGARGQLALLPGGVIGGEDARGLRICIGGEGWQARRIISTDVFSNLPILDLPDDEDGTVALLETQLTLQPHANGEAVWFSGLARHDEDYERCIRALQAGPSAILRGVKMAWSRRLQRITCTTPEDTLDLLMNRILPVQALTSGDAACIRAAAYFAPTDAKWMLLRAVRHAHTRDEWAALTLLAADYAEITEDTRVLDVHLLLQDASLFACCRSALLEMTLDRNGLPLGKQPAQRCFTCALAAKRLNEIRPDEELAELSRKLLLAADTHLWKNGCYGDPLELAVQCLASEAFGQTPRTKQAIMSAWSALYEPPHGLIRSHAPQELPALPGLPENGGMDTSYAALCIRALIRTGHSEQAFELLRALNPLHHTDTPERQHVFRCAPCLLHGGMYASPMPAGQAVSEGGGQAAAILYSVILQDVLGLKRRGRQIRLQPVVPPEWDEFTLALQEGAATWYITLERRVKVITIDGDEQVGDAFIIRDDGKIHQVRIPLT